MVRTANGDYVCQDCLHEYYSECDECGDLNNTPIRQWDLAAGFQCGVFGNAHRAQFECRPTGYGLWCLCREHGVKSMSCSEGVCVLKEAARRLVAREGGASG